MANEEAQLEEILNGEDEGEETDEGDAQASDPTPEEIEKARRIAVEECLHSIATFALELEAGKRESITAEDIRIAFASHDVEEIYIEAKIFFGAADEEADLGGEEEPGEEGEEGEEDDEA